MSDQITLADGQTLDQFVQTTTAEIVALEKEVAALTPSPTPIVAQGLGVLGNIVVSGFVNSSNNATGNPIVSNGNGGGVESGGGSTSTLTTTANFAITQLTISNNSDGTRTLWFHGSYPSGGPSAMPTGTYDYTLDGGKTWITTAAHFGLDNGAWDTWAYGAVIAPGTYEIAMRVTADPTIIAVAPSNPYIISANTAPSTLTFTPISFPSSVPNGFVIGDIVATGGTPQFTLTATTPSTIFSLSNINANTWQVVVADSTQLIAGDMSLSVTVASGTLSLTQNFTIPVLQGNTISAKNMIYTASVVPTNAMSSGVLGNVSVSGQSGGVYSIYSQSVLGNTQSGELPRFVISNNGDLSANTMLAAQNESLEILWINGPNICLGTIDLTVLAVSGPTLTVSDSASLSTLMTKINADTTGQYAGANIIIASGTYVDAWLSPDALDGWNDNTFFWPLTFEGMPGQNMPIMALPYHNAKGMLEVFNPSVNFKGIEIANANGKNWQGEPNQAGIKINAGCAGNFSIDNCYIHNCDDGILGGDFGANVVLQNTEIAKCGSATGFSHNAYIAPCASVTATNVLTWGAVVGHCFKTRAGTGVLTNLRAFDGEYGTASYLLDMPDGGNYSIIGGVFQKGTNASNAPLIHYGAENQSSHPVNNLIVSGAVFINSIPWNTALTNDGAYLNPVAVQLGFVAACATYDVQLVNCTFYGFADTQIIGKDGNANVGTITQTGSTLLPLDQAPALDWSHPFEPTFTTATAAPGPYIYGKFIGY